MYWVCVRQLDTAMLDLMISERGRAIVAVGGGGALVDQDSGELIAQVLDSRGRVFGRDVRRHVQIYGKGDLVACLHLHEFLRPQIYSWSTSVHVCMYHSRRTACRAVPDKAFEGEAEVGRELVQV